jgi:hypothetical protein
MHLLVSHVAASGTENKLKARGALSIFALACAMALAIPTDAFAGQTPPHAAKKSREHRNDKTFSENEIVSAASGFFGTTSEAVAKAVERIFADNGLPDAYIKGGEGSGAFIVGLRYGSGILVRKGAAPVKVYWQGPSVGFDVGGNASKAFVLIYHLGSRSQLYHRFPGVDGSFYFIAGIGVNYMRSGGITLAPMRTGVGLRAGVNANYLTFTRDETINPF